MRTIDELKPLVFGRGRGAGIKIAPRHYEGDSEEQIVSLARDTAKAEKHPPDDEDATMVKGFGHLREQLETNAGAAAVGDALANPDPKRRFANHNGEARESLPRPSWRPCRCRLTPTGATRGAVRDGTKRF